MNFTKIACSIILIIASYSCADYRANKTTQKDEKTYYTSNGFALIYDDDLFKQKVINKKINNDDIVVMHNFLKANTPVKIINPDNSKVVETKIHKRADYPKIFNVAISRKIASTLELDFNNPYVEIIEIKKNKIFVAKKTNTFDEEKVVAEKVPVDEVKMDVLSNQETKIKENSPKKSNFILVINDFYYEESANSLKVELVKKTKMNNIYVKKINNKKYRLFTGPFKNFNALKTTYISLNNLGFENLNIYKNQNETP